MSRYSFVFVHVYSDPTDTNLTVDDYEDNRSMWGAMPYVRMRHSDIEERHWVLCVRDALEIMRQKLALNDNATVDDVHFYTHGTYKGGEIKGRLREGNEAIRVITLLEAEEFLRFELRSSFLQDRTHAATTVHMHGCNIGVSADAVRIWRDVFGAVKGFGNAPSLFQMFYKSSLPMTPYYYPANHPIKIKEEYRMVFTEQQIEAYIEQVISIALSRVPPGTSDQARNNLANRMRNGCQTDVNEQFYRIFQEYKQGSELPWSDIDDLSRDEAVLRVRKIFTENSGFPRTFLARHFHLYDEIPLTVLKDPNRFIWPYHKNRWNNAHNWFPYG